MKSISRFLSIKVFLITMGCLALIAAIVSYFSGMSFWIMFLICIAAVFTNALVADFEDRLPGGFLNPTKEQAGTDTIEK